MWLNGLGVAANVLQVIGFLFGGSLVGLITWVIRVRRKKLAEQIVAEIKAATVQIQPGYRNGGESLADLAHSVRRIDSRVDELHEKVNGVARDFEHLRGRFDQHVEN